MDMKVDYGVLPDFAAYVRSLGATAARDLFHTVFPGRSVPAERDVIIELLTTDEAAYAALINLTPDVLAVVGMVHVLEDSASVDRLIRVSVMASEMDTFPHETERIPSGQRTPPTEDEMSGLLNRARAHGVAWEEPAGVWHVPAHVAKFLPKDSTLATPVESLVRYGDPVELHDAMVRIGILDEPPFPEDAFGVEAQTSLFDADSHMAELRDFLCDPRRVRALVGTAPHPVRRELLLFAGEGIYLPSDEWSVRRAEAVQWAKERLLVVEFDSGHGNGSTHASMVSPAALALKLGGNLIPRPHQLESRAALEGTESLTARASSAVVVADAIMERWADSGFLTPGPNASAETRMTLQGFEGAVAVGDFAAHIGADENTVFEVFGMLASVGLIDGMTGQPTARAMARWFTASAKERWAWLATGWLRGPDRWQTDMNGDDEDWTLSEEALATIMRRSKHHLVGLAASLKDGEMLYPCCIDNELQWNCGAALENFDAVWGNILQQVLRGARVLGVFTDGVSGAPARHIASALAEAWFSGQQLQADETARLIAELPYLEDPFVVVCDSAVLRTARNALNPERMEIVAQVRGVPSGLVPEVLGAIGFREHTGSRSTWLIDEDSLMGAIRSGAKASEIIGSLEEIGASGGAVKLLKQRIMSLGEAVRLDSEFTVLDTEPQVPSPPAPAPVWEDDDEVENTRKPVEEIDGQYSLWDDLVDESATESPEEGYPGELPGQLSIFDCDDDD